MTAAEFVTNTRRSENRFDDDWHLIDGETVDDNRLYYKTACGERIWAELSQVIRDGDPRETLRDPQVEQTETLCPECEYHL